MKRKAATHTTCFPALDVHVFNVLSARSCHSFRHVFRLGSSLELNWWELRLSAIKRTRMSVCTNKSLYIECLHIIYIYICKMHTWASGPQSRPPWLLSGGRRSNPSRENLEKANTCLDNVICIIFIQVVTTQYTYAHTQMFDIIHHARAHVHVCFNSTCTPQANMNRFSGGCN